MAKTTTPNTVDELVERLTRGEPLTPDDEPRWDPKSLTWDAAALDALLAGTSGVLGPYNAPVRQAYRGVILAAETARRFLGTDEEAVHFAGFCQALRFYDDHARDHRPYGGEMSDQYRNWREDLASRPVLRSLTFEQWQEIVDGAEPATEDDVPWRFPVRTPLEDQPR